jgi:aconitate hydratase
MLIPQVIGFKLEGKLPEGATATDLVLTVTQMLRAKGVVGKFVEFFGDGLDNLSLADRATISNMAPEYGATCGIFPIDGEVINYLRLTGRDEQELALVEAYARTNGMWREKGAREAEFTDVLALDMATVTPSLAGPRRPQDRVDLNKAPGAFADYVASYNEEAAAGNKQRATDGVEITLNGEKHTLKDGAVVIAAITSCTNTSNPAVLLAAGLVAKKAVERGLTTKPWVKTSLAPGSQAVPTYLQAAGLLEHLEALRFNVTGFGCTTCIGNSGPLPQAVGDAIQKGNLVVGSVLSGNRNFEGRIHADIRTNWLASPPLVVAYALAGDMNINVATDPLGQDKNGNDVYLKDLWPTQAEVADAIASNVNREGFLASYADVFKGDQNWQGLDVPTGAIYDWPDSTYIANPPYFEGMTMEERGTPTIKDARVLVYVGDSITTDHISPAGAFSSNTPAGEYLSSLGVEPRDFNSYGSRRGNHEVMMRGTFANVRLRNKMAPGTEGGWTTYQPSGEQMFIYDAAMKYKADKVPLVVLAGQEYGTGSSRDWAAKGTNLLGVQVVIAESYERIHRSNLVGMGVLPLQFKAGESAEGLGLTGMETFTVGELESQPKSVKVTATAPDGKVTEFEATVRIDTPNEWVYYRNGGILHYVLRDLARRSKAA